MKVLSIKDDIISIQLESGLVVLVKEEDFIILHGEYMNKCKVGYNDAQIMGLALYNIFTEEREELRKLRESKKKLSSFSTSTMTGSTMGKSFVNTISFPL
jgi:hypothetical protein